MQRSCISQLSLGTTKWMNEWILKKKKDHTSPFYGRNWKIDGDSIEHIAKPEDILSHCPYLLFSECCNFPIPHCPLLWYVCVCVFSFPLSSSKDKDRLAANYEFCFGHAEFTVQADYFNRDNIWEDGDRRQIRTKIWDKFNEKRSLRLWGCQVEHD